jgi:hypothetical protein
VCADGHDQLGALLVGEQQRNVLADSRRGDHVEVEPEALKPSRARGLAVAVGVDEELGATAKRPVGDGVHVADDHVRPHARVEQCVRAPVDADDDRFEVTDVRPDDRQVALVTGATGDDQRVALPEARLQRREGDPLGQEPSLLAQIAEGVLGELLQRLGHPRPLLGQRDLELVRLKRAPRHQTRPVLEDARPADGYVIAVGKLVEELCLRGIDQPHPASHEQQRSRIREATSLGAGHVDHDADARIEQFLGRCAVEVLVVDDRDIARPEPADEILRPPTQPCRASELDEAHWFSCTAEMNASPPSMRRISSRRSLSPSGSIRV